MAYWSRVSRRIAPALGATGCAALASHQTIRCESRAESQPDAQDDHRAYVGICLTPESTKRLRDTFEEAHGHVVPEIDNSQLSRVIVKLGTEKELEQQYDHLLGKKFKLTVQGRARDVRTSAFYLTFAKGEEVPEELRGTMMAINTNTLEKVARPDPMVGLRTPESWPPGANNLRADALEQKVEGEGEVPPEEVAAKMAALQWKGDHASQALLERFHKKDILSARTGWGRHPWMGFIPRLEKDDILYTGTLGNYLNLLDTVDVEGSVCIIGGKPNGCFICDTFKSSACRKPYLRWEKCQSGVEDRLDQEGLVGDARDSKKRQLQEKECLEIMLAMLQCGVEHQIFGSADEGRSENTEAQAEA